MPKAPAFQFYAAEYLADEDVQLMTLEEEGCYIRLLAFCWREGSIPADPEKLSRLCKGASTTVVSVVMACFDQHPEDSSRLVSSRLELEREKQAEWREKSRRGGENSANARKQKNGSSTRVVEPPLQPNGNTSFASSSSFKSSLPPKEDISAIASRVVLEHPRSRLCSLTAAEVTTEAMIAVRNAADAEVERVGVTRTEAAEMILERVKAIAKAVPRDEWKFVKAIPEFMRLRHYRKEPADFTGGSNGSPKQNQPRVSPAVQRGVDTRSAILKAGIARYGPSIVGDDGAMPSGVSEPTTAGGNAGSLSVPVGGDGRQVQPRNVSGRTLEGNA